MATDPVCGMEVDPKESTISYEYEGQTFHFCSEGCKDAFVKKPTKYVKHAKSQHSHHCC